MVYLNNVLNICLVDQLLLVYLQNKKKVFEKSDFLKFHMEPKDTFISSPGI